MPSRRWLTAVFVALTAGGYAAAGTAQTRVTLESDFHEWETAARQHVPASEDAPLSTIARWSWGRLTPVLERALKAGNVGLLLRGALLHADIGFYTPISERSGDGIESIVLAVDGQKIGGARLDPHLWWGRRLLDRFTPKHPQWKEAEPLVIAWYRAVAALLANRTWYADLDPHLRRGLERFPENPGLQFDAGCLNEALATPAILAAIPDLPKESTLPAVQQEFHSPARRFHQAEEHFGHAVERDGSFAEARIRLARVMHLRGRLQPAIVQLEKAAAMESSPIVRYYHGMFLGRALAASGDSAGARKSYETAAGLFPQAHGPLIGLAHLSSKAGDPSAARSFIEKVLARPGEEQRLQDPLWEYHLCAGRDPEVLYNNFVRALPPLQ